MAYETAFLSIWRALNKFVENLMIHVRSNSSKYHLNMCFNGKDKTQGKSELLILHI